MACAGRVSRNSVLPSEQIRLCNSGNLNRTGFVAATRAKHPAAASGKALAFPAVSKTLAGHSIAGASHVVQ